MFVMTTILLLLLLILHSFHKTKYISCKGQSNTMINNAFPFVIQLNCFMILMIDDYHNIHAKKVPTQLITSSAVHMASCLVDIHPTIMAVARPLHTPIHRVVRITIRGEEIDCYGGIDIQVVNQKMQQALANMKKPFMKRACDARNAHVCVQCGRNFCSSVKIWPKWQKVVSLTK